MRKRTTTLMNLFVVLVMVLPAVAASEQGRGGAGPTAAGESIALSEALVIERVGRYGRVPLPVDPITHALATGAWQPPQAGDEMTGSNGEAATWRTIEADTAGWLNDRALRGGWAYCRVELDEPRVMILEAAGQSATYVNGRPRAGDPYAYGWVRLPVKLHAGRNDLLFQCSRGRLRAKLTVPPDDVYMADADRTVPDLIAGEDEPVYAALVVVNATEQPMTDLVIRTFGDALRAIETPVPRIEPLTVRKVPLRFVATSKETETLQVNIDLHRMEAAASTPVDSTVMEVAIKQPHDKHVRTFISDIDGSVQYYAITPMRGGDHDRPAALFLTLHGASVEASGQARVYDHKDWGHVVAPTNRRPYGFDWEEWGRLDAMEVLEQITTRYEIDPRRIYLTGHSMGGHGTWQIGATLPDLFAAIGPSAGWVSFWSYSSAADYENATPMEALLRRAANPSDTLALERNLDRFGIYLLHGEKDDNVPVSEARTMLGRLAEFHSDYAFFEQPGAGHWWGNQCCDWPPMFEFFRARSRPRDAEVDHVHFTTVSPGISSTLHWITIEQQLRSLGVSSVDARRDTEQRRYTLVTDNVRRLAVETIGMEPGEPIALVVDGQELGETKWPNDGVIRLERRKSWLVVDTPLNAAQKGPHRYGPFKDAFQRGMVFVYGTMGSAAENHWARTKARFDAETFWYRGNGSVDVLPDRAFDPADEADRSVILYGNAETNAAWSALLGESPVQVAGGRLSIGDQRWSGDDLGCLLVRPRPGDERAMVAAVTGSGLTGMRLTDRLPFFVSGVAYPDVLVIGPDALENATDGAVAAGFFGSDWSVEAGHFVFQP